MAYKSPGVTVLNQFQPLLNPITGSDRILAIVAGFDAQNLNFYPIRTLNLRRADTRYCPFDFVTYEIPENPLNTIDLNDRIVSLISGNTKYTGVKNFTMPNSYFVTWDGTNYIRNNKYLLHKVTFTRNTSSSSDSVQWSMNDQTFVAEGELLNNGTDFVYGASEGNSKKRWLYYYDDVANTFIVFHEGEDFTITVEAGTSGNDVKATVTWLKDPNIPNGGKYYGLYRDINNTNTSALDPEAHTWYDVMTGNDAEAPTGYDYIVIPHQGTNNPKNIGFVIYWLKDGVTRTSGSSELVQSPPAAPEASSAYNINIRYEVPKGAYLYTNFDEVSRALGPITDPTNPNLVNDASLAGWIAFGEGASSVIISIYDITQPSSIDDAFTALSLREDIAYVTAVDSSLASDSSNLNYKLWQHVLNLSSDISKKYRIGLYHPYTNNLVDSVFTNILDAYDNETQAINSNRMILLGPAKVSFNIPVAPFGVIKKYTFNGKYLGVVYGGMKCRPEYDAATSLLRKQSKTIVDLDPKFDDIKMDKIASKGVTLFSKIHGQYTVRDDLTTSRENQIFLSEPTITEISDTIAKEAIRIMDTAVIGSKLKVPTMLEAIKARLMNMLDLKAQEGIISAYGTPSISIDSLDPRKVNVVIPVQPVFTLKYLEITFSYVAKV